MLYKAKKVTKLQNSLGNIIDTWFGRGRGWQRQRLRTFLGEGNSKSS